jgi:hypothetical protein
MACVPRSQLRERAAVDAGDAPAVRAQGREVAERLGRLQPAERVFLARDIDFS